MRHGFELWVLIATTFGHIFSMAELNRRDFASKHPIAAKDKACSVHDYKRGPILRRFRDSGTVVTHPLSGTQVQLGGAAQLKLLLDARPVGFHSGFPQIECLGDVAGAPSRPSI
jgi:hypothetical protein